MRRVPIGLFREMMPLDPLSLSSLACFADALKEKRLECLSLLLLSIPLVLFALLCTPSAPLPPPSSRSLRRKRKFRGTLARILDGTPPPPPSVKLVLASLEGKGGGTFALLSLSSHSPLRPLKGIAKFVSEIASTALVRLSRKEMGERNCVGIQIDSG